MLFIKNILHLILYQPLFNALIFLVWLIPGHNVAWAIIILTIIIRFLLLPSSIKATYQQKKMRDLGPEIQALQAKYKDDKQKQAKELMDYYKKNNINPLGSCLPILIQLPILIVLYYVFRDGLNLSHFNLLYHFTPRPAEVKTIFFGLDLSKPDLYILPILAGILQFIQTKQIMPAAAPRSKERKQSEEMQAMVSKQMLYLMPIFTVFIAGRLPAALPLYWVVTNLFMIIQQWWVLKDRSPDLGGQKSKILDKNIEKLSDKKTIKKHGVEVTIRRKNGK